MLWAGQSRWRPMTCLALLFTNLFYIQLSSTFYIFENKEEHIYKIILAVTREFQSDESNFTLNHHVLNRAWLGCFWSQQWYRLGQKVLSVRWVIVRDPEGRLRPGACFSTRQPDTAREKVAEFIKRWSDVSAAVHNHLWSTISLEKKALYKRHDYYRVVTQYSYYQPNNTSRGMGQILGKFTV